MQFIYFFHQGNVRLQRGQEILIFQSVQTESVVLPNGHRRTQREAGHPTPCSVDFM